MSKKNRKKDKEKKKSLAPVSEKVDRYIQGRIIKSILPIEQRLVSLLAEIDNLKSNLITTTNLLERKDVIKPEEYAMEFQRFEREERGIVDAAGNMNGRPIFTLYNF